jgi:hypothetical protein
MKKSLQEQNGTKFANKSALPMPKFFSAQQIAELCLSMILKVPSHQIRSA